MMYRKHQNLSTPTSGSSRPSVRPGWVVGSALLTAVLAAACSETTAPDPGSLRFGQVGEIRIRLVTPLPGPDGPEGELQEALTWNSDGPWQLFESVAYKSMVGDESLTRGLTDPGDYAALIIQLNETQGLRLFDEALDEDLNPTCEGADTRLELQIRDNIRNEEHRWIRCSGEPLENLIEAASGPDPAAARVITAARRARDLTLGDDFRSSYSGSVPFGSLGRGENSGADLPEPLAFLGLEINDGFVAPNGWEEFWEAHTGSPGAAPEVDWSRDMVLVGSVGTRQEAGDSVEIRRILQGETGTNVELFERVPGDFCSPAAKSHTPFHIVLAPRTRPIHRFGDATIERVPCGG